MSNSKIRFKSVRQNDITTNNLAYFAFKQASLQRNANYLNHSSRRFPDPIVHWRGEPSFPTPVDASGVSVRRLWDVLDLDACCLSASAPRNLPHLNPRRQAVPSGSRPVSDPLPVSFTNFIALRAPVIEHAIILQHNMVSRLSFAQKVTS